MKVLMVSGDKHILDPESEAHRRFELQSRQVEQLDLFVWPQVHTLSEIRRVAREGSYDVITVQDPFWRGHLAWHLARKCKAKLNIQVHADLKTESWFRRTWARFHLRRADTVRVVSERIRKQVEATGTKARITVLPVYVDLTRFINLEHKSHAQKIILWVGRLEDEKDPLFAVEVLRDVRARGIDARLVILGAGTLGPTLHRVAETLPVDLPGWQDPKPYFELADVVLSTSKYESWGASIIEALAAGVPVVAPDVGVAREAGAIVTDRAGLASKVTGVLTQGARGTLLITLPSAPEWATRWKESLV